MQVLRNAVKIPLKVIYIMLQFLETWFIEKYKKWQLNYNITSANDVGDILVT